MGEGSRYLLLLGCSERKFEKPGLVRAKNLYDGVFYRVVRKSKRGGYWPDAQVVILSAKYGLIDSQALIEHYDLRMTPERARALQTQVGAELDALLVQCQFDEVFVNLGKNYLLALVASQELPQLGERVRYARGGIGERMAQMKGWLIRVAQEGGEPTDNR